MPLDFGMPQRNVAVLSMQRFLTMFIMHGYFDQDLQYDVERERSKTFNLKNQGSILAILGSYQQKILV